MPSLLALQGAASLIARQPALSPASPAKAANDANAVVAVANGFSADQGTGAGSISAQAQKKISEALFDVQQPNIVTLQARLVERIGLALGVDADNFETNDDYIKAIGSAFRELLRDPKADSIIAEMEKDLGLDKLGISLKTVIEAITGENPSAQKELNAALRRYADEIGPGKRA